MDTQKFPAWYYGPDGTSDVFESADDIPAGWTDHPSKVVTADKTGSKPLAPRTDVIPPEQRGAKPIEAKSNATAAQTGAAASKPGDASNTLDAAGWPFDGNMHAATQTLTKDGLWRMKVGVSRPAPKEGYPKPGANLDL